MSLSNDSILEAMLNRATDPIPETVDELAVQIFCVTIRNDMNLFDKAMALIISKIQSSNVAVAMRAISLLEECMRQCGTEFQDEVAKFRFLNSLTRLVSRKYEGKKMSNEIRDRILDCLLLWTTEYPDKVKIREVYNVLRVEGHKHGATAAKKESIMGPDEDLFLALLNSNDVENFKRANYLIQSRVNQVARKTELLCRHKNQLEEVRNTVLLLNQMLDLYEQNKDNAESIDLMKELFESCENNLPIIQRVSDTMANEDLVGETRENHDNLKEVIQRYKTIVQPKKSTTNASSQSVPTPQAYDLLSGLLPQSPTPSSMKPAENLSTFDELTDIFSNLRETTTPAQPDPYSSLALLTPVTMTDKEEQVKENLSNITSHSERSQLSDIDSLSEKLLKEHLKASPRVGSFKKEPEKVSLNTLAKEKMPPKPTQLTPTSPKLNLRDCIDDLILSTGDDQLESIPLESKLKDITLVEDLQPEKTDTTTKNKKNENTLPVIHLADINVQLDDVIPTDERCLLDDDIKITLTFTSNRPSPNVQVIVISVVNQNKLPVSDFQFYASVPKPNKVRLLAANGNSMPGCKPFRPPTPIHQIMLLLNPTKANIDVTCIVGYRLGDDPDTIKESIVAKNIAYVE